MALPVLCLCYWTMSFEGIHKQIKHTFLDAFNLDCVCLIQETSYFVIAILVLYICNNA